ncbi:hypothetical protein NDU88_003413 [Pleurodeles waltl]|uniref:Uncharacterized protein n=1 Tax=Pleurodeles waltl TaxID=8319 RepID=A0AAV7M6Y6_PLEWA|nr:hypothetical protein NDU88_003413 [Pleurodeles waltl]
MTQAEFCSGSVPPSPAAVRLRPGHTGAVQRPKGELAVGVEWATPQHSGREWLKVSGHNRPVKRLESRQTPLEESSERARQSAALCVLGTTPLSDAGDWSGVEWMTTQCQGDHLKLDRGKHKVCALCCFVHHYLTARIPIGTGTT